MRFRLKTLFATTAVAGLWFFLARLNPWLPVLLVVMFGPATVAFLWCPAKILVAMLATLTVITGIARAAYYGIGMTEDTSAGFSFTPIHVQFVFAAPGQASTSGFVDIWGGGNVGVAAMHSTGPRLMWDAPLPVLLPLITAYGATVHLLARWLELRKAAHEV